MIVMCLSNLNIRRKDLKEKDRKNHTVSSFLCMGWSGDRTSKCQAILPAVKLVFQFFSFFEFLSIFFFKCRVLKDPCYLFLSTGTDVYSFSIPESPNNLSIRIRKKITFSITCNITDGESKFLSPTVSILTSKSG